MKMYYRLTVIFLLLVASISGYTFLGMVLVDLPSEVKDVTPAQRAAAVSAIAACLALLLIILRSIFRKRKP